MVRVCGDCGGGAGGGGVAYVHMGNDFFRVMMQLILMQTIFQ